MHGTKFPRQIPCFQRTVHSQISGFAKDVCCGFILMRIDGSQTDLRAPTIADMSHISPFVSLRIDKLVKYRIPPCHYFGIHLDFLTYWAIPLTGISLQMLSQFYLTEFLPASKTCKRCK